MAKVAQEPTKTVVGYTDRLSVAAGEQQQFMLSTPQPTEVRLQLVELICGDTRARGAGFQETLIASHLDGTCVVDHQPLYSGSYGVVTGLPQLAEGELEFYFYPTLLEQGARQVLLQWGNLSLALDRKQLFVHVDSEHEAVAFSFETHRWHHLVVRFKGRQVSGTLSSTPVGVAERARTGTFEKQFQVPACTSPTLYLAARHTGVHQAECFNGRLEAVTIRDAHGVCVASWSFAEAIQTDRFLDVSGNEYHGRLVNHPTRAVRGRLWDGSCHRHAGNPDHYAAVHFHDDDLTDAGWTPTVGWEVPVDLPSGQYALKVTAGEEIEYVPFFVRPADHHSRARVVFLASTATYLAYANQRLFLEGMFATNNLQFENDVYLRDHIEIGLSLYEHHRDGSGVHYSSYLRPVLNMKPRGTMWSFNADTNVTAWLRHINEPFDVVTDHDLHLFGADLLSGYQVLVTGTHPEYYSRQMRTALEQFLERSGRLMYMGGNGFYWKIAFDPNNDAVIEVRRAEGGTRAWMADPGEYYQGFDGELGGMWRRSGQAPNTLVGVGFAAQGFDGATYYRLTDAARDPRVGFMFEGTSGGPIVGDFGAVEGGAAGQEIDRWDPALGSPAHALVVAQSEQHNPGMLRVIEEFHMTMPHLQGSSVRADMTFFETPAGGAVFSTGSISYAGSLAHNNYDNDIARITGNVLRRFADSRPFEFPPND